MDPHFTVTIKGLSREVSLRRAMRLAGKAEVTNVSSNYQETRAAELATMLERESSMGAFAIFQSADAINGLKTMANNPGLVEHAVLAYPAGVIHQPNLLKASAGVVRSGWSARSARPVALPTAEHNFEVENGKKAKRSRAAASLTVAASVALSDQSELLTDIRRHDDSPGVSLVLGTRDWMIRPERVISSLRSPNDVDTILVTDQPHGLNGRKAELEAWLGLLPVMVEAKEARRKEGYTEIPLKDRMRFFGNVPLRDRNELLALAAKVG